MVKDLKQEDCIELLRENYIGRLGYVIGKNPFVVPITYYYHEGKGNGIISYSLGGHKIDAMRNNRCISLQIDEIKSASHWKSVLVHGEFEELKQIDAKNLLRQFSQGVKNIINRSTGENVQFIHEFSSKLQSKGSSPIVYRINILEITGKQREG